MLIRIGHTCVALKHKKTDLSVKTWCINSRRLLALIIDQRSFETINFPFLGGDVPRSPLVVHISAYSFCMSVLMTSTTETYF